MPDPTPTAAQAEVMKSAIIQKAIRFLMLPGSPLGAYGEFSEGGVGSMSLRPDYAIREMLYGLGGRNWDIDLTTLVTPEDVIRIGFNADPDSLPEGSEADIQTAIESACHWVAEYLLSNGFALGGLLA